MFHFMSKQAQVEIPLEARKASFLGSGRTYDYWVKLIEKYIKIYFHFSARRKSSQSAMCNDCRGQRFGCFLSTKKATQRRVFFSSRSTADRNIQCHNTFILAPTWMINSIGSSKPPRTKIKGWTLCTKLWILWTTGLRNVKAIRVSEQVWKRNGKRKRKQKKKKLLQQSEGQSETDPKCRSLGLVSLEWNRSQ